MAVLPRGHCVGSDGGIRGDTPARGTAWWPRTAFPSTQQRRVAHGRDNPVPPLRKRYVLKADLGGKRVRCKNCGHAFEVRPPAASEVARSATPKPLSDPFDELFGAAPSGSPDLGELNASGPAFSDDPLRPVGTKRRKKRRWTARGQEAKRAARAVGAGLWRLAMASPMGLAILGATVVCFLLCRHVGSPTVGQIVLGGGVLLAVLDYVVARTAPRTAYTRAAMAPFTGAWFVCMAILKGLRMALTGSAARNAEIPADNKAAFALLALPVVLVALGILIYAAVKLRRLLVRVVAWGYIVFSGGWLAVVMLSGVAETPSVASVPQAGQHATPVPVPRQGTTSIPRAEKQPGPVSLPQQRTVSAPVTNRHVIVISGGVPVRITKSGDTVQITHDDGEGDTVAQPGPAESSSKVATDSNLPRDSVAPKPPATVARRAAEEARLTASTRLGTTIALNPKDLAAWEESSRDYTRGTYVDLIAGDDETLKQRMRWLPGGKRPSIGVRWGLGIQSSNNAVPDSVDSPKKLAEYTGPAVPAIGQALEQRLAGGKFGDWPGSLDPRLQTVDFLGIDVQGRLIATARRRGLDAIVVANLSRQAIGLTGRFDVRLTVRLIDVAESNVLWTSKMLTNSQAAAAQAEGKDLVAELVEQVMAQVEENFALVDMPAMRPEHVRNRAEDLVAGLSGSDGPDKLLPVLTELRYYVVAGLLTPEEASPLCEKILGQGKGGAVATGSRADAGAVLEQWLK